MKVYIPKSMIKKAKSMARHNSDIKIDEEAKEQAATDLFSVDLDIRSSLIDSAKVTAAMSFFMTMALWGFYG